MEFLLTSAPGRILLGFVAALAIFGLWTAAILVPVGWELEEKRGRLAAMGPDLVLGLRRTEMRHDCPGRAPLEFRRPYLTFRLEMDTAAYAEIDRIEVLRVDPETQFLNMIERLDMVGEPGEGWGWAWTYERRVGPGNEVKRPRTLQRKCGHVDVPAPYFPFNFTEAWKYMDACRVELEVEIAYSAEEVEAAGGQSYTPSPEAIAREAPVIVPPPQPEVPEPEQPEADLVVSALPPDDSDIENDPTLSDELRAMLMEQRREERAAEEQRLAEARAAAESAAAEAEAAKAAEEASTSAEDGTDASAEEPAAEEPVVVLRPKLHEPALWQIRFLKVWMGEDGVERSELVAGQDYPGLALHSLEAALSAEYPVLETQLRFPVLEISAEVPADAEAAELQTVWKSERSDYVETVETVTNEKGLAVRRDVRVADAGASYLLSTFKVRRGMEERVSEVLFRDTTELFQCN